MPAVIALLGAGLARGGRLAGRACVAWLALALGANTAEAEPDAWWGRDKALHFGISAGLAGGGYALSAVVWEEPWQRALGGAGLALGAGVGKELWDLAGHGRASARDLAWDAIGAAVGTGVALGLDLWLFRGENRGAAPARAALALRW